MKQSWVTREEFMQDALLQEYDEELVDGA